MIVVSILIVSFFILSIGCFFIKKDCFEDSSKKNISYYSPLLDDSYSERVV